MSITTDRDIFTGFHLAFEQKENLRREAARRKTSMSQLLSQIVEDWLVCAPDEQIEPVRSNKRHIQLLPAIPGHCHSIGKDGQPTCGCKYDPIEVALSREQDVPIPFDVEGLPLK